MEGSLQGIPDVDKTSGFDLQDHDRHVYFNGAIDDSADVTEKIASPERMKRFGIGTAYRIDRPIPNGGSALGADVTILVEQGASKWNVELAQLPHLELDSYQVDVDERGPYRETWRVYLRKS